jgi:uncharacterized membrane protein
MTGVSAYLHHHERFYSAAAIGLVAFGAARAFGFAAPLLLGGDIFFAAFLIFSTRILAESPVRFSRRADSADEGIAIVMLVTLAAMIFFCAAVFEAINTRHAPSIAPVLLAALGAPLGWLVLHTVMAFHYANLHYFDDPETPDDDERDLEFPGCAEPGPWDFLYFSFVVGMTCQVSDVQVKTMVMRRAVLGHGVVSFFFNTVFIAMAVNAAVAMAS